ncbi:MAG: PASTA domain-containing protein, partial [Faecousia sp.]
PSELMPGIPLGLEQIVMRAMSANADDRYGSATEMLHDMEEFRKNPAITFYGGVAASETPKPASQRPGMTRTEAERYAAARAAKNPDGRTPEERRAERARREKELAEQKRRRNLTIAIVAAVAVFVILLVVLIVNLIGSGPDEPKDSESTSDIENGEVEVESFIGMRLEDIDPDDYPDLIVDVRNVKSDYSDEYEEGYVMAQSPKAGDMVKRGRTVTLTVSKGTEEKEMPRLENETETNAMKTLEALNLGLKIVVKDENSSDVKQGSVVRTEPDAGEKLQKGQEVILYISLGQNNMPDLKNDTRSNAETRLRALDIGLSIIFLEEESDNVEEGRVTRTDPAAGSQLKAKDTVTVYISTGDGKVTVPPVIGFTKMEAISLLKDAGLMYEVREMYDPTVEAGKVISQSEMPNSKVEKGTVVVLDVSLGAEPTTEPPTEPPTESTSTEETSSSETETP